jgi:hypothetical protein
LDSKNEDPILQVERYQGGQPQTSPFQVQHQEAQQSSFFNYNLNSTGSSFEVDDALSLPAQGKPLEGDLEEMEKGYMD